MNTDVIIVGGGLSGLALAWQLEQADIDYLLLESRERLGGRILSHKVQGVNFDLGPSWFWPGQPRMMRLLNTLEIGYFEQYSRGELMWQDENGLPHRNMGFASMQGAYRISNGSSSIIDALAARLPAEKIRIRVTATDLQKTNQGVQVITKEKDTALNLNAKHVVLALPPRIAATNMRFTPALTEQQQHYLIDTPTWMAGHAKFLAFYDQPYWREQGLSGDASSRMGPMVEIHDASPEQGGPYALFGFMGIPAAARHEHRDTVIAMAKQQLATIFGADLNSPLDVVMQDWAYETATAIETDRQPVRGHHDFYPDPRYLNLWQGSVKLASTETVHQFWGVMEGALDAADRVFNDLKASLSTT